MTTIVVVLHVLVCFVLMLTVLLQPGKSGGMGAAFGGGGNTGSVFGGAGASGFLRKITVGAAGLFMLTAMTLAWVSSSAGTEGSDAVQRYIAQEREAKEIKERIKRASLQPDAGAATGDASIVTDALASSDAGTPVVDAGNTAASDANANNVKTSVDGGAAPAKSPLDGAVETSP